MTVRKAAVVTLALLVPSLLGIWLVTRQPLPQTHLSPTTVAAVAHARTSPVAGLPVPVGTGLTEAHKIHEQLLNEAETLPTPSTLPLPEPPAQPISEQFVAPPPVSDVPPERQVAVAFTGNVVGETDPCG